MSGEKPATARSYRANVIDDNAIVSINLKWLAQIAVLIGMIVYGYWQIESRIKELEKENSEIKKGTSRCVDALDYCGYMLDSITCKLENLEELKGGNRFYIKLTKGLIERCQEKIRFIYGENK